MIRPPGRHPITGATLPEEWEWLHTNGESEIRSDDPHAHLSPLAFTIQRLAAEHNRNQPLWPGSIIEQPARGMSLIREWENAVYVCEKEIGRRRGFR